MKHVVVALATGAIIAAAPATASAASLVKDPAKPCYGSGDQVHLVGSGFTPFSSVVLSRDGQQVGDPITPDASGVFGGTLTVGLNSGRETRTYVATDSADPTLTASVSIVVNEVDVGIKPKNGAPGRRLRIKAEGFTTGRNLWTHVVRGRSKRHIKLGRLQGACHNLTTRKRVLGRKVRVGTYLVQFDAFRKYDSQRDNAVRYSITVSRVIRPAASVSAAASSVTWRRLS